MNVPDDTRIVLKSLMESDYGEYDPSVWEPILARPGLQAWAGYRDPSQLEYIGEGRSGVAFRFNDRYVLKLTQDPAEAEASNRIKGRRLTNVNRIHKVAKIRDNLFWVIVEAYLPGELDDFEASTVDSARELIKLFADDTEMTVAAIPWESRKTRREFLSFVDRVWADSLRKLFASKKGQDVLSDILRGLTSLRRSGVGYADFHSENVRKNTAGQFVLFDLGASQTADPNPMDVIERMRHR
jgi:hypothetical protein